MKSEGASVMELEGKIALVTGAGGGGAGGQGRVIALALAAEGADVAANDINLELAEATASEVKASGRRSMAVKADVSVQDEVNQMVERIISEWGGIDILVNNAGFGNAILVEDMTGEEWRRTLGVNLDGTFYCSKAVIKTMKLRGGGSIINISSPAGKSMTVNGCAGYTAAKAGVLGFTRHLAFEVGPYHITVNSICPGMVIGGRGEHAPSSEQIQSMKDKALLKDITRPEDTANAVLFLASDKARMITGTNLDAYAVVPGGTDYWEAFVKRRKELLTKRKQTP
jgi:NAD(P)-dependent dehydrogenase (short-subunit alcohol dehydrogenase family)